MQRPDAHRDYVRARHSDLLRLARAGELAARIGEARREDRRTFLARLHHSGVSARPVASG